MVCRNNSSIHTYQGALLFMHDWGHAQPQDPRLWWRDWRKLETYACACILLNAAKCGLTRHQGRIRRWDSYLTNIWDVSQCKSVPTWRYTEISSCTCSLHKCQKLWRPCDAEECASFQLIILNARVYFTHCSQPASRNLRRLAVKTSKKLPEKENRKVNPVQKQFP